MEELDRTRLGQIVFAISMQAKCLVTCKFDLIFVKCTFPSNLFSICITAVMYQSL